MTVPSLYHQRTSQAHATDDGEIASQRGSRVMRRDGSRCGRLNGRGSYEVRPEVCVYGVCVLVLVLVSRSCVAGVRSVSLTSTHPHTYERPHRSHRSHTRAQVNGLGSSETDDENTLDHNTEDERTRNGSRVGAGWPSCRRPETIIGAHGAHRLQGGDARRRPFRCGGLAARGRLLALQVRAAQSTPVCRLGVGPVAARGAGVPSAVSSRGEG